MSDYEKRRRELLETLKGLETAQIEHQGIMKFAKWCYVNGIDFSYMAKATDTEPFVVKVINRFNAEIRKKVE